MANSERSPYTIASEIISDFKKEQNERIAKLLAKKPDATPFEISKLTWQKRYFGAVPYLSAMASLNSMKDSYGWDSAIMIVNYFLSNVSTWKGETAKRIKKELNDMVKNAK